MSDFKAGSPDGTAPTKMKFGAPNFILAGALPQAGQAGGAYSAPQAP